MEKAIKYAKLIEDWDDLKDPQNLAFYYLGLEPSAFVLRNINVEEKKNKC